MTEPGGNATATDAQTLGGHAHPQNGKDDENPMQAGGAAAAGSTSSRVTLNDAEQQSLSVTEWTHKWQQQDAYVTTIEQRLAQQEGELNELRQNYERTKCQLGESQQREKLLVRRLAAKEQEMQDYVCQVTELKTSQAPTTATLRSTLLDPAVNGLLQLLRTELQNTKAKLEETQNDLSAWKFTPDSNTGKRLMAKCRLLYQENEELGKITSSGRIAILEGDLALQKKFSEEVRQSQLELDSFLADLDEDVDGMQSTIIFLQQELRRSKDTASLMQEENAALRLIANGSNNNENNAAAGTTTTTTTSPSTTTTTTTTNNNNGMHNNSSSTPPNANSQRANGDSSGAGGACNEHDDADERTTRVKRVRRSSVLSIDYNDEDMCNTNGDNTMISDAE